MEFSSAWEALLVLITMYILSASLIFGYLMTEDLGSRPIWANNPSRVTILLFFLLWPLWILIYSFSLLYGSWRIRWEKLYKLLKLIRGICFAGLTVAMAVGITMAVSRWLGDIGWIRIPVFFLGLFLIINIMGRLGLKKKGFDQRFYT